MRMLRATAYIALLIAACAPVRAHVQVFVPEVTPLEPGPGAAVELDIRFVGHAIDNGPILPMARPASVGVLVNGKKHSLDGRLEQAESGDSARYIARHTITEPSAHVFYLQPAPYLDRDEGVMITHYTKVAIHSCAAGLKTESAMGWENWEGWDARIGFPVEIEPLVQPTALWTGSIFRGLVLHDGKPAPFARVEVEYYDKRNEVDLPSNAFMTQILKTDANGVFALVPVRAGWWAMSAIREADAPVSAPDGSQVPHEQGGVFWIEAVDMR